MEISAFKLMGGRSERVPLDQAANVFPVKFIHLGVRQGPRELGSDLINPPRKNAYSGL